MIHKIARLTSIGKYRNYNANGDVAFKKLTLLYGDNGGGKTTLTTIFRSLAANDPGLVSRRKSVNETTPQALQIIQRNSTGDVHHTFNPTTGWSQQLPNVEIFDIHFINDNIFSGFNFTEDHKRQLHQFVIGAQGVSIQQQIEQNKVDKTAVRQLITNTEQQIAQQVANNLTIASIPAFIAIQRSQSNNIDSQITEAEAHLTSANSNSTIQALPILQTIPAIRSGIDLDVLQVDLQTTSHSIQNAILETLYSDHCTDLSDNNLEGPQNWLQKGFNYITTKNTRTPNEVCCPFCKKEIDHSADIIIAYTTQFNTEFNALVERIQTHIATVQNFNLQASLQAIQNIVDSNIERITTWSAYLSPQLQQPEFDVTAAQQVLSPELQSLSQALTQKAQNPSTGITQNFALQLKASIQAANAAIIQYNSIVSTYNNSISTFRSTIQTIAQAQAKLDELRRIKQRFEPAIDALCTNLGTEKNRLTALDRTYAQLTTQQEQAASAFFVNYKNRINYYLDQVFKTAFKIEGVTHVAPQGRATQSKINYKLTIEGHDISFDPNQLMNVKDCLSEGDKSTIALALFLSKLDIDPSLSDKIIVFDDPLSSFDTNRRMYTVQILKNLIPRIKQLVVLSHNEFFLHDISNGIGAADKKTLRIVQNYTTKASIIEPLDLDSLVENAYFKNVKELGNFLSAPDIAKKDYILGLLRNVLETHLRFKFPRQIASIPTNQQTFGRLITTLDTQNIIFRDNANRAAIISKLALINSISWKPHHGEVIPDYATLGVNPSTITESELANFITDTLRLIDDEL